MQLGLPTVGTDDSHGSDNAGQMILSTSWTSWEASLFDEVTEEPVAELVNESRLFWSNWKPEKEF